MQYKSVLAYISEGKAAGGTLIDGGKGTLETTGGYFVEPTVFENTPATARVMKEEIFWARRQDQYF